MEPRRPTIIGGLAAVFIITFIMSRPSYGFDRLLSLIGVTAVAPGTSSEVSATNSKLVPPTSGVPGTSARNLVSPVPVDVTGGANQTVPITADNATAGNSAQLVSPTPELVTPTAAVSPTPLVTMTPNQALSSTATGQSSSKININTADYDELQAIIGVGPVIAQRIIDYRETNGPFRVIEDIKEVKGIGNKTFDKMRDQITI